MHRKQPVPVYVQGPERSCDGLHCFSNHPTKMEGNYREEAEKQDQKPGFSTSKRSACHISTCQASVILQNKCKSSHPVQQKHSLNKTGGVKSLPHLFLLQRKQCPKKSWFVGGFVRFFVLPRSDLSLIFFQETVVSDKPILRKSNETGFQKQAFLFNQLNETARQLHI